jgi:hypothetical protein
MCRVGKEIDIKKTISRGIIGPAANKTNQCGRPAAAPIKLHKQLLLITEANFKIQQEFCAPDLLLSQNRNNSFTSLEIYY